MAKQLLRVIEPYVTLYRDTRTGIAWVENGHTGTGHSAHPNIDKSGSIRGMKQHGGWSKYDRCVRSHGLIYNIDISVGSDAYDHSAAQACLCGGQHA